MNLLDIKKIHRFIVENCTFPALALTRLPLLLCLACSWCTWSIARPDCTIRCQTLARNWTFKGIPRHLNAKKSTLLQISYFGQKYPFNDRVVTYMTKVRISNFNHRNSVKGILHQKIFYRPNLIFWIVMGCGIARFGRRGLKITKT